MARLVNGRFGSIGLRLLVVGCMLLSNVQLQAQRERGLTRDGNKLFNKQKYVDAEVSYKKALDAKNNFSEAVFNLGDAYFQQKRYQDAAKQFELAAKLLNEKAQKAKALHNLGNCAMAQQQWSEAVHAYKQALKQVPADKDTRYNLAFANEKLREQNQQQQQQQNQQPNQQNQQKDQKQQDQQQNKDNQNKGNNQKKDGQDKKDQQQQEGKNEQQEGQQPKQQKGALSKEQAEKLLEALKAEEQKANDKMQKKNARPVEVKIEKDW
ncbi:MAG: tetratricopeptide repeat protein [Chitinophagales bacterium]